MGKRVFDFNRISGVSPKTYSNKEIVDFWDPPEMGRFVLDTGSGRGERSESLKELGHFVISVDVDPDVFLYKHYLGINCVVADSQLLPFRSEIFTDVYCIEVLEHLIDPDKCIFESEYVLKKNGYFICTTPCLNIPFFRNFILSIHRRFIGYDKLMYKPESHHTHLFSDKQILDLCNGSFSIIKKRYNLQTLYLTIFLGLKREIWDKIVNKIPLFPSKLLAQGLMILAQKPLKVKT